MTRTLSLSWNDQPIAIRIGGRGVEDITWSPAPESLPSVPSAKPDVSDDLDRLAEQVTRELEEYRSGTRRSFSIPYALPPSTPWRRAVWEELARIPYGSVVSYRELGRRLGCPGAARAVGQACGANPLPILIPCHRVVGSGGRLGGYSGGERMKRYLLRIEGVEAPRPGIDHGSCRKIDSVFAVDSAGGMNRFAMPPKCPMQLRFVVFDKRGQHGT